jgi:hypothetical protein
MWIADATIAHTCKTFVGNFAGKEARYSRKNLTVIIGGYLWCFIEGHYLDLFSREDSLLTDVRRNDFQTREVGIGDLYCWYRLCYFIGHNRAGKTEAYNKTD